jgi:hypothetical protein
MAQVNWDRRMRSEAIYKDSEAVRSLVVVMLRSEVIER